VIRVWAGANPTAAKNPAAAPGAILKTSRGWLASKK
jgi:hypothetical protein